MKKIFLICTILFFCIQIVSAQTTITGKVTFKKDKSPIEGAAISVKGYKIPSVITDNKGNYIINIPAGAKVLEASYTGMQTQTQVIGKKKTVNFKMIPVPLNNIENNKGDNKVYKKPQK